MTYHDKYNFPSSRIMDTDLALLRKVPKEKKPHLFIQYCYKVITTYEEGGMPLRDAAYSIARTMFIKELEDPLFEEITFLAGELELPPEIIDGAPDKKWERLVGLVEEYKKEHKF